MNYTSPVSVRSLLFGETRQAGLGKTTRHEILPKTSPSERRKATDTAPERHSPLVERIFALLPTKEIKRYRIRYLQNCFLDYIVRSEERFDGLLMGEASLFVEFKPAFLDMDRMTDIASKGFFHDVAKRCLTEKTDFFGTGFADCFIFDSTELMAAAGSGSTAAGSLGHQNSGALRCKTADSKLKDDLSEIPFGLRHIRLKLIYDLSKIPPGYQHRNMVLERQSREIRSPLNGFPVVFNFDLMLDGLTSTFWLTTMQSRRPEWLTTRDLFDAGYGLNSSGDGRLYHETLDQTNLHYNLAKYPLYEDSKYPSDRIDLLIEVFRQLFAVYDEWRQVRKGVDSRIRSLAKEKKHREILEVIKEYYTNEEMHHMEHGGKFMFLLRLVTFIHKARIPSVDERILRHLSGDY